MNNLELVDHCTLLSSRPFVHFSLYLLNPSSVWCLFFSILFSLYFLDCPATGVCYPPVVSVSSLINAVFNHSAVLFSFLYVSTVLHFAPAHLLLGDSVHHAFLHLPRRGKTPRLLSLCDVSCNIPS